MKSALICLMLLAASAVFGSNAQAAPTFPEKEITIIVPYSAGG